jgi:site-specific recombinase XerC
VITKTKTKYPGITKITTAGGDIKYRLIIAVGKRPDGKWIQECYTFPNLTQARKKQTEIKAARDRGTLVKRDSVTFDELCQRWLDSRHDVREVTRLGYEQNLKAARALLGQIKAQDLNRTDLEKLIKHLQERGLSHRSITYPLGAIRQVLAYGISAGLLSVNVAASVKAPRKQQSKALTDTKPKDEPWTHEELLEFRAVADQDEWAAVWRLTLCGLRRSEIMGLKWDAVDLDRDEVRIEAGRVLLDGRRTTVDEPKSKASQRSVPMEDIQPGTVALLRSLRARQAADRLALGFGYQETGLVLVDPLGAPVRPELYSDRFRRLSREAGLRVIHLHLVRHTLAVAMDRAGVAPVDAAPLLGHTVDVYVSTYLRPSEQGAWTAADVLGAALAAAGLNVKFRYPLDTLVPVPP